MWHKGDWMGHPMRLELTPAGLLVKLANHYTTRGAPLRFWMDTLNFLDFLGDWNETLERINRISLKSQFTFCWSPNLLGVWGGQFILSNDEASNLKYLVRINVEMF